MEKKECTFLTNCFDPIRFWAALSVMILHYTAYALMLSDDGVAVMHFLGMWHHFFRALLFCSQ